MAAQTYGTAHLFGVSGTISNATVLEFTSDAECVNRAATANESGNEIERRYDDEHITASITLKIRSGYTIPAPGSVLTYETVAYEITKVGRVQKKKEHRIVKLDLLKSEYVATS